MDSSTEFAELAKVCANHARLTTSKEVARELWRMAKDYQERAAKLDSGDLPAIGEPPPLLE
jgi:hypothetical protein